MPTPTQSVAGGFLFVLLGLLFLVGSPVAAYAGWVVYQKEAVGGQLTGKNCNLLFCWSGVSFLIALFLISFGIRLAWKVGQFDSHDPKEPHVKW
jgi:hypothetical protein